MNTPKNKICTPRVVLIASESLLLDHALRTFAERPMLSVPVINANETTANWLTSAVTGVDTPMHGIADNKVIDPSNLQIRSIEASDRLFPAFWNTADEDDARTHVIDWPATTGDESISQLHSIKELNKISKETPEAEDESIAARAVLAIKNEKVRTLTQANIQRLLARTRQTFALAEASVTAQEPPDAMAILLRSPHNIHIDHTELTARTEALLVKFITTLPPETIVLILQKKKNNNGVKAKISELASQSRLAILGGEQNANRIKNISVRSIASVIRTLLGLPLPMGTLKYAWPFLRISDDENPRWVLPNNTKINETDYIDLATRIMAMPTDAIPEKRQRHLRIIILTKQIRILISKEKFKGNWPEMAQLSRANLLLSNTPLEHWSLVIAMYQSELPEELTAASATFIQAHPECPEAQLGEAMALMPTEPKKANSLLEGIEENTLQTPFARNILGRFLLRSDNPDRGAHILSQAITNKSGMPIDHLVLATFLMAAGKPEEAMDAIGNLGQKNEPLKWQLIRTRILIECGHHKEAQSGIEAILQADPMNDQAQRLATLLDANSPSQ